MPVLPLRDQIGRFSIRLFADNNRTPCRHCNETTHPCFKCTQKDIQSRGIKCWQCGGNHHKKDCTEKKRCRICNQDDHLYQSCPTRRYGVYANDILEGREADETDAAESDSDLGDANRKEPDATDLPRETQQVTEANELSSAADSDDPEAEVTPA